MYLTREYINGAWRVIDRDQNIIATFTTQADAEQALEVCLAAYNTVKRRHEDGKRGHLQFTEMGVYGPVCIILP